MATFPHGESISFDFILLCTIYTTSSGFPCITSSPLVTPCSNWRFGFSSVPFSVRLVRTSPVPRRLLLVPLLEPDTSNGSSPINHAFFRSLFSIPCSFFCCYRQVFLPAIPSFPSVWPGLLFPSVWPVLFSSHLSANFPSVWSVLSFSVCLTGTFLKSSVSSSFHSSAKNYFSLLGKNIIFTPWQTSFSLLGNNINFSLGPKLILHLDQNNNLTHVPLVQQVLFSYLPFTWYLTTLWFPIH